MNHNKCMKFKDSFWKDTYVCTLSFIGCNICSLIYIIYLWMISIRNCIYIWIKVFSNPASRLIPISATVISIFIACSEKAKSETSCWPRIKLEKISKGQKKSKKNVHLMAIAITWAKTKNPNFIKNTCATLRSSGFVWLHKLLRDLGSW